MAYDHSVESCFNHRSIDFSLGHSFAEEVDAKGLTCLSSLFRCLRVYLPAVFVESTSRVLIRVYNLHCYLCHASSLQAAMNGLQGPKYPEEYTCVRKGP